MPVSRPAHCLPVNGGDAAHHLLPVAHLLREGPAARDPLPARRTASDSTAALRDSSPAPPHPPAETSRSSHWRAQARPVLPPRPPRQVVRPPSPPARPGTALLDETARP